MNRFCRRLSSAHEAIRLLTSASASKLRSASTLLNKNIDFMLGAHQIYSVPLSYSSCKLHLATALSTNTTEIIDNRKEAISKLGESIKPLDVRPNMESNENVGEELVGVLKKDSINKILTEFKNSKEILNLSKEIGLTEKMFSEVFFSFRRYCIQSFSLPAELHVKFYDIQNGKGNNSELFPFFHEHAYKTYPHVKYMEELEKISDIREPAFWYPETRKIKRKIIYHSGPTNSGKTYTAFNRFKESSTGVYCGPLKLLANEISVKTNSGADNEFCDLITGDEKRYVKEDGTPSSHYACTVEMVDLNRKYEVAVIDEIQMIGDAQRGWAWTRALLGVCADEVHICGDASCINLIESLCEVTGDELLVNKYSRLTNLTYLNTPLESLSNVRPGDCIVCFSKKDILAVVQQLEKLKIETAVIYGSLPPGVKTAQASRFNDPNDPCKVLVATDAIGMGLNLNIKRIIFRSVTKIQDKKNGENKKEREYLNTSQALQIAGRAGRYGTQFPDGEVTTLYKEDLKILHQIVSQPLEPTDKAGISPTAEQLELFSFHLPKNSLRSLVEIFTYVCKMDNSKYFMCNTDIFKVLADTIEHIPLPMKARYVFASAPIDTKTPFVLTCFIKYVRSYSRNEPLKVDAVRQMIEWPLKVPKSMLNLLHLEAVFDVLELYLWLSYRFSEMFPDADKVRELREEIDYLIDIGVKHVIQLISLNKIREMKKADKTELPASSEKSYFVKEKAEGKVHKSKSDEVLTSVNMEDENEAILKALLSKGVNKKIVDRIKKELSGSKPTRTRR